MKKIIIALALAITPGGIFALNGSFNASNNTNVSGDINYLRLDATNAPVTGDMTFSAGVTAGTIFELNSDGDVMPTENGGLDNYFEINEDGDITPINAYTVLTEDGDITIL